MNETDNQVRAAHKILGYNPIQKSFSASKYVIRATDSRLHRITVVEHGFLLPEGSPVPEGVPLAGPSSSHQAAEAKGGRVESEEEVANLGVRPRTNLVYSTKLIYLRIPPVTWATLV